VVGLAPEPVWKLRRREISHFLTVIEHRFFGDAVLSLVTINEPSYSVSVVGFIAVIGFVFDGKE
jgi:hypothetical protein